MPNRSKPSHNMTYASYRPVISLMQAKVSYFIHDGKAHSVADCSDDTFKEAILKLVPNWITHETYAPILEESMDIHSRWFLLCSLADSERGMKLYTREELIRTMQVCELIV